MNTELTFKELQKDFETTPKEQTVFNALKTKTDWLVFSEVVERYILKLTYNLVAGTELEANVATEELKKLRGFIYYWNKVKKRIEYNDDKTDK